MADSRDAEVSELRARLAAVERRAPSSPKAGAKGGGFFRFVLWTVAIILGLFIAMMILGAMLPKDTSEARLARAKAACEAEFGADTTQAMDCQLRLVIEAVDRDQADRMRRARSAAN